MCTSLTLPLPDGTWLFGRTLDWHEHFDEHILHTPQGFPFGGGRRADTPFPEALPRVTRFAIVGMGTEADTYPLYADACNECGLSMAGLRFAEGAYYMPAAAATPPHIMELAPWELIPCVLGLCASMSDVRDLLARVRVVGLPFYETGGGEIPTSPLHWLIADCGAGGALAVEATARGLEVYDASVGVMANDPAYPQQTAAYEQFLRGREALPGDYTSTARFIRAAEGRKAAADALADGDEVDPIACFFHLAAGISPPAGETPAVTGQGFQTTQYTACMDGARGRYYYTTAEDGRMREVRVDGPSPRGC